MFNEILSVLDQQFRFGLIDPRAYAEIRGTIMIENQRLESCNVSQAIDLYNAIKAVLRE